MQKLITAITFLLLFFSLSAQPLKITPLTGDFYIYTTYNIYKGDQVPANGMYLVTSNGVMMIDTPWDSTQFQPLLDSIQFRHHKKVVLCIDTYVEEDRKGEEEVYQDQQIEDCLLVAVVECRKKENKKLAAF